MSEPETAAQDGARLPDHPARQTLWWQAFVRLARPAAQWGVFASIIYLGVIGPATGQIEVGEVYLAIWTAFMAAVLGLTTFEKWSGVR